jgi:hypothetical protein
MLYEPSTKTVIEVVPPGQPISDARLVELARMQGCDHLDGQSVEKVAVVFLGGTGDAVAHLPSIKRFGLGCRTVEADGTPRVLHDSTTMRVGALADRPDGTLLPFLREASWPHAGSTPHRRLLGSLDDGPYVTFGWDTPTQIHRLAPADLSDRTLADVEADALAHLAARDFQPALLAPGRVTIPGEHCSEAILLPAVMERCAALLGADLIAVGIPKESRLAAVDASDHDAVATLIAWPTTPSRASPSTPSIAARCSTRSTPAAWVAPPCW